MGTPRARGTGSIFKPKGSSYYWIAYVSGGKRRYESTKSTRKKDATDLLISRLGDVAHGIVVTPKLGKLALSAGLTAVVNDLKMNGRKAVSHSERRIRKHLLYQPATPEAPETGYFNPDRRMNTITTSDLTAYTAHRLSQGASAASVNHELATVKRAFRLALRAGELVSMPYIPMLKLHNVRTGFFERSEFDLGTGRSAYAYRSTRTGQHEKRRRAHVALRPPARTGRRDGGPVARARTASGQRNHLSLRLSSGREADQGLPQCVAGRLHDGRLPVEAAPRFSTHVSSEPCSSGRAREDCDGDHRAQDALGLRPVRHRQRRGPPRGDGEARRKRRDRSQRDHSGQALRAAGR